MTALWVARKRRAASRPRRGPGGLEGPHTYPDCGEPLVIQFIAAWGERRQRSCHSKRLCTLRTFPVAFSMQALESSKSGEHGGSHAPVPEGGSSRWPPQVFFPKQGSDLIGAWSTNYGLLHCILERGQTPELHALSQHCPPSATPSCATVL